MGRAPERGEARRTGPRPDWRGLRGDGDRRKGDDVVPLNLADEQDGHAVGNVSAARFDIDPPDVPANLVREQRCRVERLARVEVGDAQVDVSSSRPWWKRSSVTNAGGGGTRSQGPRVLRRAGS